jgi:glutamate racemase
VQIAEEKLRGTPVSYETLRPILAPFFSHPKSDAMDTLVLACTHFPLLREELAAQFSSDVFLIDSGEAIARRVAYLLEDHVFIEQPPLHQAVFTQASTAVEALRPYLLPFGVNRVDILTN